MDTLIRGTVYRVKDGDGTCFEVGDLVVFTGYSGEDLNPSHLCIKVENYNPEKEYNIGDLDWDDMCNFLLPSRLEKVSQVLEHSDSEQELIGIEATLNSRGAEYGEYKERSSIEQRLKDTIRDMPTWDSMDDYQKSSLEMIVHKISRLCGNPDNEDTWHDIAGYASLVVNNLDKSASLV
ncbi:DUF6378 domain-containing protein [Marinicella marina]|uniref:DUF6378 domain-containing protein n=1 Tax=Marinicella marina TaxID=2996016 RepID=UPI0024BC70C8|nr:DUF6378 domain-containing protein [Marinicella marina]MDJ1139640.1 DUF6378 domain-containing protein [Marinicella marina]